jgi:predicted DNA-binding transcriptional regulator AlpA
VLKLGLNDTPCIARSAVQNARTRIESRGLSRVEAAIYVGVSPSLFDEMVRDGRMPCPKRINSRSVWDRRRLDNAFDALPEEDSGNPWDDREN